MLSLLRNRMGNSWISFLLRLLNSPGKVGSWAEQRLIAFGPSVMPRIRPATGDPSPHARYRAVYILGKIGAVEALDVLWERAIDEDEDIRVRCDSIFSIGYVGDSRGIPLLKKMLPRFPKDSELEGVTRLALSWLEENSDAIET